MLIFDFISLTPITKGWSVDKKYCAITADGECEEFPCDELNRFYNDGVKLHQLAYRNMLKIREDGIEKWLAEQEKVYTCR